MRISTAVLDQYNDGSNTFASKFRQKMPAFFDQFHERLCSLPPCVPFSIGSGRGQTYMAPFGFCFVTVQSGPPPELIWPSPVHLVFERKNDGVVFILKALKRELMIQGHT